MSPYLPSPPFTDSRRATLTARVRDLMVAGEELRILAEGDLYLRAYDGYFYLHRSGILAVTTGRAFLVSGPRTGRRFLEHTEYPPQTLKETSVVRLQLWKSIWGVGPADFQAGQILL